MRMPKNKVAKNSLSVRFKPRFYSHSALQWQAQYVFGWFRNSDARLCLSSASIFSLCCSAWRVSFCTPNKTYSLSFQSACLASVSVWLKDQSPGSTSPKSPKTSSLDYAYSCRCSFCSHWRWLSSTFSNRHWIHTVHSGYSQSSVWLVAFSAKRSWRKVAVWLIKNQRISSFLKLDNETSEELS